MEFGIDLPDGFGDLVIHARSGGGDEELGLDDASDGRRSQAEGAEELGEIIGIRFWTDRFEETPGKDTNEGNLFDETGGIGGFDTGEVTFMEAAGVKTMLKGVEVAFGGATATGGSGHSD